MKKSVSRFVTLLILCSFLVTLPKINIVKASGTIYIRADGSIDPSTAPIQRVGDVYTFTDDVFNAQVISVERNNTVINGKGHTLYNGRFYLQEVRNVTIENMGIQNYGNGDTGIDLDFPSYVTIANNSIEGCGDIRTDVDSAIRIFGKNSHTIVGNTIRNNIVGIQIGEAPDTLIYNNNFIENNIDVRYWNFIEGPSMIGDGSATFDNGKVGNYWSRYTGTDTDGDGTGDTPYLIDAYSTDHYPLMNPIVTPEFPDTTPPAISIVSPENKTYTVNHVDLTFTVDEPTSWMGYVLNGQANVTIAGNTTLSGLSDKTHSLTVYARDLFGNIGSSFRGDFTINAPPSISIVSPKNKTYTTPNIPLNFTATETISWIGYSLDGQANNTIAGNTTLTALSDGMHSLIVYARDSAGNTGASETIHFSIAQQSEPFPTWIIATIAIIAVVGVAFLVYFRKVRKTTGEIKEQDLRE